MEKKKEIAVTVKDLNIFYKDIKKFSLVKSGIKNLFNAKEFHAVKNVSFEIPKGQILGICVKNGSGKSTLLRAIAGIFSADSGTIDLHGNTISLLSIGVGFKEDYLVMKIYSYQDFTGLYRRTNKRTLKRYYRILRTRRFHLQTSKLIFIWYVFKISICNNCNT